MQVEEIQASFTETTNHYKMGEAGMWRDFKFGPVLGCDMISTA
jgi:hypothetical protein